MTEAIVNYLNLKLETVGRLGVIHCLAELRSDGVTNVPYVYSGTGQVVPINIDGGNLSYWRMPNPISFEPIVGKYGVNQMSGTYDLRLVVVARRKDSTVDDAFMPTRLAEDIANQITGGFPDLKLLLKAQSVSIRVNSIDTNIPKIWGEEFTGTQVNDLNYTRAIMALSVSVTVIGSRDCWQNECDIDPNILHIFDFCNPNVVAELTPTQVACLEDALCEPCADVTIDINGVPFDTVPSGGTLDIPVIDTGSNPVGSQIGTDYIIANNATYINSVQVTDQAAEQDAFIAVELDGSPSGTWNAGTQTWEVTSAACSPVTFQINGTPQESIAAGATFNLIATLDGTPGGTYNAATDTLAFTSTGGWVRPSDWIAIPDLTSANERFYGVVAVFENGYNQVSVAITNLAANINWGDGTSVVSNGGQQIKVYNYSTLSATIYQWPDGRNYKMALVDITRVGGAIASIDFWATTTINRNGGNNFLDINCSLPNCSTLNLSLEAISGQKAMPLCQRLRVWNRPAAHSANNLLRGMRSLRSLQYPYSSIGTAANFSFSSGQVDNVGNINLGSSTQVNSMWAGSQLKKHGNLTANSITNLLVSYCVDALQLTEFGSVTATSCTSLQSAWNGCVLMTKIGVINTPLCQSLDSAFLYCYVLEGVEFTNCVAITSVSNCYGVCPSLSWAIMPNLTRGISFANTAMGNYGMNLFANSIGIASGAQTITITGTPFGALVTAADATALAIRAVMTGKGYTIAN
jgi:hypothetical protein